jgi:TRAP-type C4-dicarboxylate transport system substrate-binding protein
MSRILSVMVLVVLTVSMLLIGCAPKTAAPEEEIAPPEEAPAVIEWRFHTPHTEGRAEFVAEEEWRDMLFEATNGRLKVTIYPGGSLGYTDDNMLRIVGEGVIESAYTYGGYCTRDEPILSILVPNAAGVFTNRAEYVRILPYATEQARKLYADWGCRLLSFYAVPGCYVGLAARDPINTLEGMKGLKLRAFPDPIQIEALKSLGVSAETFPQADMYLNLKNKVVDAAVAIVGMLGAYSLTEVTPYFSGFTVYSGACGHMVSEDAFQALPADIRDIVLQVTEEHTRKWNEKGLDCSWDDETLATLVKEQGLVLLDDFSDEDKEALSVAAIEAWAKIAEQYGPKAVMYQELMQAELERIRAS